MTDWLLFVVGISIMGAFIVLVPLAFVWLVEQLRPRDP